MDLMHVSVKRVGLLPVVLPAVCALFLSGSPAQAQDPKEMSHKLVREKILHDAIDRYDVKFMTTNTQHLGPRWLRISGRGSFRRRGKPSQQFMYHVKISPRSGATTDLGYNIR